VGNGQHGTAETPAVDRTVDARHCAAPALRRGCPSWQHLADYPETHLLGEETTMIIIGIVLLLLGFLLKVAILWTLGIIVLVVGLILLLLGSIGHAVGPRRHYW
jgi:Family of unknown function (DUF6131)